MREISFFMANKILFIWPQEPFLPQGLFKHFVFLGETAEYAKRFGEVKIYDLSVRPEKRKTILAEAKKSDYIFIPIEAYNVIDAINLSKTLRKNGDAKIISYGSVPSVNPFVLSPYFDYVLKNGHWQIAIKELILDKEKFEKSLINKNIYDKKCSFESHEWCFPALDLLPMEEYSKIHPNQLEFSVQRGCVFNCPFCNEKSKVPEARTYQRDPSEIVEFLKKNKGYYYYFDATTFTQNREWVRELCKLIKPLKIKWRTVTRIDQIDEEFGKILSEAGCDKIGFGVESFLLERQKEFKKVMTPKIVREKSDILIKNGIVPRAFFILGLPNQTKEEILETQEQIEKLGIEYRWKEYISFEKVKEANTIEDFKIFERSNFPKHKIPGVSFELYNKLSSIER